MDEQADSITVRVRAPWSRFFGPQLRRFSTAVEARATLHWGGYTDPAIEAWHSISGAFNFRRDFYGKDELHLRFRDDAGQAFDLSGHGRFAIGDLVLRNQFTVFEASG